MDTATNMQYDVEEYSVMERPSLVTQIKSILDEYPDNGQIINELIQNADDARATEMKILFDARKVNEEQIDENKYRKFFRAPALVVYNNAEFGDQDWRGIKMIYNSVKTDEPLKTGRFGLGFKSVFHLTDFPCIVSGDRILFMNPQEALDERVCVTIRLHNLKLCKAMDINECLAALNDTFGFSDETIDTGIFKGSMFWFPLRQKISDLSGNIYDESKVKHMFTDFMSGSINNIIFLRSVQSVRLFINKPENKTIKNKPDVENAVLEMPEKSMDDELVFSNTFASKCNIFSVELDDFDYTLLASRNEFFHTVGNLQNLNPDASLFHSFQVTVKTTTKQIDCQDKISTARWLVVNYLKGGQMSYKLKGLLDERKSSFLPLVGVAARVYFNDDAEQEHDGHIYCFLPLPQEPQNATGLPVHVNAMFELSQNRKYVKWPPNDQDDVNRINMDESTELNILLVSEILPDAYVKLVEDLISLSQCEGNPAYLVTTVYNSVPDLDQLKGRWKTFAENIIQLCSKKDIMFTENEGGTWINNETAVVASFDQTLEEECTDTVTFILKKDEVNVAEPPNHVISAIQSVSTMTTISPTYLISHLQTTNSYKQLSCRQKEHILRFLVSKINVEDNLFGQLELLPLNTGQYTSFSKCLFVNEHLQLEEEIGDDVFCVLDDITNGRSAVNCNSKSYRILLEADHSAVEKRAVNAKCFFLKYFLPHMENNYQTKYQIARRNKLLKYAICMSDEDIDEWMRNNLSIPTKPNGLLKSIIQIIDQNSTVGKLFSITDERFPAKEFDSGRVRERLNAVKLQRDILSNHELLERAESITTLSKTCPECAVERSRALLKYLYNHPEAVQGRLFHTCNLSSIAFIPVKSRPPKWQSVWAAEVKLSPNKSRCKHHNTNDTEKHRSLLFDMPSSIYFTDSEELVGCLYSILDEPALLLPDCSAHEIFCSLGIKKRESIDAEIAIKQLEELSKPFNSVKHTGATEEGHTLVLFEEVYQHLNGLCDEPKTAKYIAEQIKDKPHILVSNMCTTSKKTALNSDHDCAPYLFSLQNSPLRHCTALCHALEVREHFEPSSVCLALQEMYHRYTSVPLESSVFSVCLKLLDCLYCSMLTYSTKTYNDVLLQPSLTAIYAPDKDLIMRDTMALCLDDNDTLETKDNMRFIHSRVPVIAAKAFGVKSKLFQNIDNVSESVEFFQDEPLVTRLHGLLYGYPCDCGIFKELLQNADDAGATEIHFLLDTTTHESSHVFGERSKELQGPALCVFNDKSFTQKDLKSIQTLGKSVKVYDPTKTGQYGVGFNAVYHLTDVPSFLTKGSAVERGETLCYFDPTAKYIPNVSRAKPGRRFLNLEYIRLNHKDVLRGFHEEFFFKEGQEGTVFRLPLRTAETARVSDVKKEHISIDMVSDLFSEFKKNLSEMLLFLKTLEKISISRYTCQKGVVAEHSVNVHMSVQNKRSREKYFEHQRELASCKMKRSDTITKFSSSNQSFDQYDMSIYETGKQPSTYHIIQATGFKAEQPIPDIIQQGIRKGELGLLPQGAVAVRLPHNANTKGKKANNSDKEAYQSKEASKLFCFLPLPVETDLPVHVHGHFALDHESRRSLWKSENTERCLKTQWNMLLIQSVITPAYVNLLQYMQSSGKLKEYTEKEIPSKHVKAELHRFLSYFPACITTDFYWKYLKKCVYQNVYNGCIDIIPVTRQNTGNERPGISESKPLKREQDCDLAHLSWISLKKSNTACQVYNFDEEKEKNAEHIKAKEVENTETTSSGQRLKSILQNVGMNIVSLPENIRISMKFSEVPLHDFSSKHVIDFLCSAECQLDDYVSLKKGCQVEMTPLHSVQNVYEVTKFCLEDEKYASERISDLPLILTQDGVLSCIQNKQVFVTKYSSFFPGKMNCFLHQEIQDLYASRDYIKERDARLREFKLADFIGMFQRSDMSDRLSSRCWDKSTPSTTWIRDFWKFFWSETVQTKSGLDGIHPNIMKRNLAMLAKCPLLPVVEPFSKTANAYLLPVGKIDAILDIGSFQTGSTLKRALEKLQIHRLDQSCFNYDENSLKCEVYESLLELIPNSNEPHKVLRCLELNIGKIRSAELTEDEAHSIILYLSDSVDGINRNMPNRRNIQQNILMLPIFETCSGTIVSLSSYTRVCVVPKEMPLVGLDVALSNQKEFALVAESAITSVKRLYAYLGFVETDITDIYMQYIIPSQGKMNHKMFYEHLKFIYRILLDKIEVDSQKKLLCLLSETAFIHCSDGDRRKPKEMFHSKLWMFRRFFRNSELLPEHFENDGLLGLLKQLELNYEMSVPLFERFASEIAKSRDRSYLSKYLVQAFMKMPEQFHTSGNFDKFRHIKCIVPATDAGLCSTIHQQYTKPHSLICFSESVSYRSLYDSLTCADVLPSWASPKEYRQFINERTRKLLKEKLQILDRPKFDLFIRHFKNVCLSLNTDLENIQETKTDKVSRVMESIYENFKEYREKDAHILSQLLDVPTIYFPVEKIIRRANNVVVHCQEDQLIPGHLVKSPEYYGKYQEVFIELGAHKNVTSQVYVRILQQLKCDNSDGELLPSEFKTAQLAVENLLRISWLCHTEKQYEDCIMVDPIQRLFLPNYGHQLHDAKTVVVCDNEYYQRRLNNNSINYLADFEYNQIRRDEAIDCFKKLGDHYRPMMLTDVVREDLQLDEHSKLESELSVGLAEFLHCQAFVEGLIRLMRHAFKQKQLTLQADSEAELSSKMRSIEVIQVKGMTTVLSMKTCEESSFNEYKAVPETSEPKGVHIEEVPDGMNLYFQDKQAIFNSINRELALYINKCLHMCLTDVLLVVVMKILDLWKSPENIQELLDKNRIDSYRMDGNDTASSISTIDNTEFKVSDKYEEHQITKDDKCTQTGMESENIDDESFSIKREPYQDYTQAQRWQRQAWSDLCSAESALAHKLSNNWICYICHQASEKSLKAAHYAKDASKLDKYSHCLEGLAQDLGDELTKLAEQLSDLTGNHTRMRYPDELPGTVIPAEAYSERIAESACQITKQILAKVSDIYVFHENEM